MGVKVSIIDSKFYNQFYNGIDYADRLTTQSTSNLTGSVMENIKVVQTVDVSWTSQASVSNKFTVSIIGGTTQIKRESGSFFDDGFVNGDYAILSNYGQHAISRLDEDVMYFDAATGVPEDEYQVFTIAGTTKLSSLIYSFGLINNDDTFNISSKISGNDQAYYVGGITTAFKEMEKVGNYKDWQTGAARVKVLGTQSSPYYAQRFEIEHEFTIVPYYLDGQLNNLENNLIPELLEGLRSLKYVYEPKFRTVISNPNTEKAVQLENNLGSVAWFNESFNGFANNYEIESISYKDAYSLADADGLLISSKTLVTIEVNTPTLNPMDFGDLKVGAYVSYLPTSDEYTNTNLTDLKQNFLYDNAITTFAVTGVDGSTFITNLSLAAGVTSSTITFEVEYDNDNKRFLTQKNSQQDVNYLIGLQIGDESIDSGNSDRVMLLADVNKYDESADIDGLIKNTEFKLYPHQYPTNLSDGWSSVTLWNEDGFAMTGKFDLVMSRGAFLNSLEFRMIAENKSDGSFFELDNFVFDIANTTVSGGIQMFNLLSSRNYNLEDGSQFNNVSLTKGDLVVDQFFPMEVRQGYNFTFSQKISWQDWIANNLADTVFYDSTKPNDNLNYKSSNYSDISNYDIKISMFANVSGENDLGVSGDTDYHILSPAFKIYDYDEYIDGSNTNWNAEIETFNAVTGAPLNGRIMSGEDTLFRTTWTNVSGANTSANLMYAIHRIEETGQNGYNIDELSTIHGCPSGNRLIPKGGYLYNDIYDSSPGVVISECLIDGSKIRDGVEYNISSRMAYKWGDPPNPPSAQSKVTSPNDEEKDTSGNTEPKEIS